MSTHEGRIKVSIAAFFFFVASGCTTLASYEYIHLAGPSTGHTMQVATVGDFVKLVEAYGSEKVFVYHAEGSRTSQFTIVHNGVAYTVDGHGFKTIADYQTGTGAGFQIGARYYRAKDIGLDHSREDFDRYLLSYFFTSDDFKKAVASGIYEIPYSEQTIAYPHTVAVDDFESILLPLLVRAQLRGDLRRPTMAEGVIRQKIEQLGLMTAPVVAIFGTQTSPTGFGASRQTQDTQAQLARVHPEQFAALAIAVAAEIVEGGNLRAWQLPYEKAETTYRATSRTGWQLDEPSLLFYLAPIFGYSDLRQFLTDYPSIVAARQNSFETLADSRDAEARGFPSADHYYRNRAALAFERYEQYKQFTDLRISPEEFNESYRVLLGDLDELRSKIAEGSWYEAVFLHVLSGINSGESVSLDVLKRRIDDMLRTYSALRNLDGFLPSGVRPGPRTIGQTQVAIGQATDQAFESAINTRTEEISSYGSVSRENSVFTRR